jgi:DNA-binding beta-propeller fold protein YncE
MAVPSLAFSAGQNGVYGSTDGCGANATFYTPMGVSAQDDGGNVYVADSGNHLIRRVSRAGCVTTFAGSGFPGFVHGMTTAAQFNSPSDVAVDFATGAAFIADTANNAVRVLSAVGAVTLRAGVGSPALFDGENAAAMFKFPAAVAFVTADSTVAVADTQNNCVRLVGDTHTTTAAGSGVPGFADGAQGAMFSSPSGIAADGNSVLFVSDTLNFAIRKVIAGVVSTLYTGYGVASPYGVTVGSAGYLLFADALTNSVNLMLPDNSVVLHVAGFSAPRGVSARRGVALCTDIVKHMVFAYGERTATPSVSITRSVPPPPTPTRTGGATRTSTATPTTSNALPTSAPPTSAPPTTATPQSTAVPPSAAPTPAASSSLPASFVAGGANVNGSTDGYLTAARFDAPMGVAYHAATGSVFVADYGNNKIRVISPSGNVGTLTGSRVPGHVNGKLGFALLDGPTDVALGADGVLYFTEAANHGVRRVTTAGFVIALAGSGVRGLVNATAEEARFSAPLALAWSATAILVADTDNNVIRSIHLGSLAASTLAGSGVAGYADGAGGAASFNSPGGIALHPFDGTVFVCDRGNHAVRKITTAGIVSTFAAGANSGFADGAGSAGRIDFPRGLASDVTGGLYLVDERNNAVRSVSTGAMLATLVNGLTGPTGIAVDLSGTVMFVADTGAHVVRRYGTLLDNVTSAPGTPSPWVLPPGLTSAPTPTTAIDAAGLSASAATTPSVAALLLGAVCLLLLSSA